MSPAHMDRIESSIRTVLAFNEAFNSHDVAGMLRLMSEDCVFENTQPAPDGEIVSGKEAQNRFWQGFFNASPAAHIEIEEIFGMGMRCVMRWKYTWVDQTGASGHVRGVDVYQVRNGLIYEKLSYVKG
jgi:limonene-1,2-epoxide hydrolase